MSLRPLQSPPQRLVDARGKVAFGLYNAPIRTPNLRAAHVGGWPGPFKHLRFKQWQHYCVVSDEVALMFAVVDAGVSHLGWIQAVVRDTGERYSFEVRRPPGAARVSTGLFDEHTRLDAGEVRIHVHNHLDRGIHHAKLLGRGATVLEAQLDMHADGVEPLVVALPVGRGRAMYSHKVPLPCAGHVQIGSRRFELAPERCTVILDIHKAHYPHETFWKWSTFAGFDEQGRRVALNLTRNVVADPSYNENGLWVDGALTNLGPAHFDLSAEGWTMGTLDGTVQLSFVGEGQREEHLDTGVLVSRFTQKYGRYTGRIDTPAYQGTVSGWFGLAEDHYAAW